MASIKNELSARNRIDCLKKLGHEKNMIADFKGNMCKQMMIYAKYLMTQTSVSVGLIAETRCLRCKVILGITCSCLSWTVMK